MVIITSMDMKPKYINLQFLLKVMSILNQCSSENEAINIVKQDLFLISNFFTSNLCSSYQILFVKAETPGFGSRSARFW